jgi:uncharacterized tellurite resistance protein B-like protein
LFDTIKKVLSGGIARSSSEMGGKTVHPDMLQLAVCVLLLEVAHADDSFSEADHTQIMQFFQEGVLLSPEATRDLLLLAEQTRQQATELWQFTHLIAENFSLEEKLKLVEAMWKIIYIDGRLDMREDYLIHKLSSLLGLRHSELIDTKLRVLRQNAKLEPPPPPDTR